MYPTETRYSSLFDIPVNISSTLSIISIYLSNTAYLNRPLKSNFTIYLISNALYVLFYYLHQTNCKFVIAYLQHIALILLPSIFFAPKHVVKLPLTFLRNMHPSKPSFVSPFFLSNAW